MHRALADVVREGRFREDLYYRLNVLTVDVPALRARGDLTFLAEKLLAHIASRLDQDALELGDEDRALLCRHSWPGKCPGERAHPVHGHRSHRSLGPEPCFRGQLGKFQRIA